MGAYVSQEASPQPQQQELLQKPRQRPPELLPDPWIGEYDSSWSTELASDKSTYFSLLPADIVHLVKQNLAPVAAAAIFVSDAEAGIAYVHKETATEPTPQTIAAFLHTPNIYRPRLGDYLGKLEHAETLRCYLKGFDFTNMKYLAAVRCFLGRIRFSSEGAPLIPQVLRAFVHRWLECHPEDNEASARIVLGLLRYVSTDQYEPHGSPMSKADFLRLSQVATAGVYTSKDLEEFYDDVSREPLY